MVATIGTVLLALSLAAPAGASEPTAGVGADDSTIQMSASEMQEP